VRLLLGEHHEVVDQGANAEYVCLRADHHSVGDLLGCKLQVWYWCQLTNSRDKIEVHAHSFAGHKLLNEVEPTNFDFTVTGNIDVLRREVQMNGLSVSVQKVYAFH